MAFDVAARPALRFGLFSDGGTRHAFVIAFHHMLLDAWSAGLVISEIFSRYDGIVSGTPIIGVPAAKFEYYLGWLTELRASGELDRQASFWRERLAEVPPVLELPADRSRPAFAEPHGARAPLTCGRT